VAELESTVTELGAETWREEPEWCSERLSEMFEGANVLDSDELLYAQLWFLFDSPLPDGDTAIWRLRQRSSGPAVELLSRSELRAWRIDSVPEPATIMALCPLGGQRARLCLARSPAGDLAAGASLVARSVPVGPGRWVLLGRPRVVDRDATTEFDALLASLDAPRGEVWRVHGGVLARAARRTLRREDQAPSASQRFSQARQLLRDRLGPAIGDVLRRAV
jgi:hypothetical protein